ncbi:glutamate 5-kinase [Candidatus Haliotispira prima]|uniref:Glutamate 5-kinase n=1 Tax=Candidatus Haliotispira prima TaxID=3034016 RepID=A0ABY8MEY0_9SPIO|nr:glutamate 5-kinase [Candidatus Haliotispira prima]
MTIVVKVGSQSLLEKGESSTKNSGLAKPDLSFMADLVGQIACLKEQGHNVYLISSGAVAAGRGIWHESRQLVGQTAERQILAGLGQVELMQIYKQIAAKHQLHVVQLLLAKSDFISRNHYLNLERLLLSMQDFPELLPVINENDSVSVDELMFTDNDQLAGVLGQQLGADLLLLLTEASGVYDKDPRQADARLFRLLGPKHGGWPKPEGKSSSGRGGISSKLETAGKMCRAGVVSCIASARQPQIILRITEEVGQLRAALKEELSPEFTGAQERPEERSEARPEELADRVITRWSQEWFAKPELGTLVLPSSARLVRFLCGSATGPAEGKGKPAVRGIRKWLSARDLAAGRAGIIVNDGLVEKLQGRKQAVSILPVGIVRFRGEFGKGDLIDIYSEQGAKIGIGLARYSHLQLAKTISKKNQEIFIHYNYLHINEDETAGG